MVHFVCRYRRQGPTFERGIERPSRGHHPSYRIAEDFHLSQNLTVLHECRPQSVGILITGWGVTQSYDDRVLRVGLTGEADRDGQFLLVRPQTSLDITKRVAAHGSVVD